MLTYKGLFTTNTGSDSTTYSSATYNNTYSKVTEAYCCNTYKDTDGNIQYINYPMYYEYNSHVLPSPYRWRRLHEGWIYTSNGWKQFYGRPDGIYFLYNIVFMKNFPFTLVAVTKKSYTSSEIIVSKVTPTGLSNLSTILNYKIIDSCKSNYYKIIIAGISTTGKFAVWECGNDEYHFDMIWEDDTIYSSYSDIADMSCYSIYDGSGFYSKSYVSVNIVFHINNNSIKSKCIILGYDYINDIFYRNSMTSDVNLKPVNVTLASYTISALLASNNASTDKYGHIHFYVRSTSSSIPSGMSSGNKILGSTNCNSIVSMYFNNTDLVCSATVNNTGYIYQTTDSGSTWTQKFYGDNCYKVIIRNLDLIIGSEDTYFWAVGDSSSNYYRACGVNHNGGWWSSKVTFPSSTLPSNRIQIPGSAFLLANSSTVYTYDMNLIANGTDQTVVTKSLTDENGNNFVAKDAYWVGADTNSASEVNHTFYVSTNETNGTVLSEYSHYDNSAWTFTKQTIDVGGPVILSKM